MKTKSIVLLLTFLTIGNCFINEIKAEPLEFIFEHYSSDDGLPHNSICDIHQDTDGYLWLCTWYGLSRFDGTGFVNYTMLPGDYSNLSHNRILSVEEDAAGFLWIQTYDYHLYRFDVRNEAFVEVPAEKSVDIFHCDRNGYVWVAVDGTGLFRFAPDLSYRLFNDDVHGHIGKKISGIYEDSLGVIYAVSENGISVISGDAVSLITRAGDVLAFDELPDGDLAFLSPDRLLILDRSTKEQKWIDLAGADAGNATSMTVTDGKLFVGFRDNTIAYVDPMTSELVGHRSEMGRVRYLFPDPEGLLWIATDRTGIWSYDSSKDRFRHYEHSNNVMSYYTDTLARVEHKGGRLWIKMNNYGFGYYDRHSDEIIPLHNVKEQEDCRFMNGVACFEVDSSGILWMSTVGRGLEKVTVIDPKTSVIVPPTRSSDPLSSHEIRAMMKDSRGNLWIAAKSRELYRYSPDLESCVRYPDSRSGDLGVIYSLFEDRDGNIWIGTKGDGLIRMTPEDGGYSFKRYRRNPSDRRSISSNNIYSITQDHDGRIWIGTYGGGLSMLQNADSEDFVTVENSFPDYPQVLGDRVRYLHCMPDGRMLVATVGGLVWFEPSEIPELTVFNLVRKIPGDIHSLGNNDVIYMFTSSCSDTWLCTFGGGLNRIRFVNGTPVFDVISTEDGLKSNIIQSAIEDSTGKIWAATEAGLSSIDPSDRSVVNYSRYDGVASVSFSEAACASLDDGTLLFGTLENVLSFKPESFSPSQKNGRLTVTGLVIDGRRTPFDDRIIIPHDYSFFRIDFASLDYSINEDYSFSYILEGYDKDWISTDGTSNATFSGVPPGNYTFRVSASESGEVVSMKVRVRPSLWNSTVSIIIYILIAVGVLVFLIRIMMTSMKLRNDVRLEQDISAVKSRFLTNISHELRTPLTLILGGIEDISRNTGEDPSYSYSVNLVRKNAKRMMTLVNQLLDIRTIANGKMKLKVSHFDVVRMVEEVYDDFKDMAAERKMDMRIIKSVDSLMVWGDSIRLEALVYNLLSNAFKYTSDGGKIEVGVLYREGDDELRIMVKDNGVGVPEEDRESIFQPFVRGNGEPFKGLASSGIGLSFCKEIADVHGGTIWVESGSEPGSKFFVRLPLSKERFDSENVQFMDDTEEKPQGEQYGLSRFKLSPSYPEGAMKVLVVEDNAELRVYIYNLLINRFEVMDASNGVEALEIIKDGWVPDLIVTDLMMPRMDGIELINNIRKDFAISHIPIILITAKHENDTHLKAMKYGADGYIAKPFTMELLIARIDNLLERRRTLITTLSSSDSAGKKSGKIEIMPEEIVITDKDEQLVKKIMEWLEANFSDPDVTVDQLATYVGMGRTSMYNKIKGLTGKSPVEIIQEFRMERATHYLKSGQFSISETSYKVGFSDPGYFTRSFKKHFGITPAEYVRRNK
ncbi:MAG: response regulator [Bacteroidales bacterium]|nr:response regulator [Bacteroidales bacterium]